jgi:hypothetical protein
VKPNGWDKRAVFPTICEEIYEGGFAGVVWTGDDHFDALLAEIHGSHWQGQKSVTAGKQRSRVDLVE